MKIIIRTKNLELTGTFRNFIEEKIGSLKKFVYPVKYREAVILPKAKLFNGVNIFKKQEERKTLTEVFFEIEKETKHHNKGQVFRSEARILLPGKKITASAAGDDLLLTVVEIKDKLQQEIKKYKEKAVAAGRRKQGKIDKF